MLRPTSRVVAVAPLRWLRIAQLRTVLSVLFVVFVLFVVSALAAPQAALPPSKKSLADAHRRFAQAFRALPAIPGRIIAQTNEEVRLRLYESGRGTYIGVGHNGYATASETLRIPCGEGTTASLPDLVSGQTVRVPVQDGIALLPVTLRPMSLQAYRLLTPRP